MAKSYKQDTIRIWNSLRKIYNINPFDFTKQKDLIAFLKRKKSRALNIAKKRKFWLNTKILAKVEYNKTIREIEQKFNVILNYVKHNGRRYKVRNVKVVRNKVMVKILKKRKDGKKQHYWVTYKR